MTDAGDQIQHCEVTQRLKPAHHQEVNVTSSSLTDDNESYCKMFFYILTLSQLLFCPLLIDNDSESCRIFVL